MRNTSLKQLMGRENYYCVSETPREGMGYVQL